jgi:hypothetical protein
MRSEVKYVKPHSADAYPCVMMQGNESKNFHVLFSEEGKGMVISSKTELFNVGDMSINWQMSQFRPVEHGTVITITC